MSKAEKLVERMRTRPQGGRMASLEVVAGHYGMTVRKTGRSHFVFLHARSEIAVSIPFRRPNKPVCIAQFVALIDDIGSGRCAKQRNILLRCGRCRPGKAAAG